MDFVYAAIISVQVQTKSNREKFKKIQWEDCKKEKGAFVYHCGQNQVRFIPESQLDPAMTIVRKLVNQSDPEKDFVFAITDGKGGRADTYYWNGAHKPS